MKWGAEPEGRERLIEVKTTNGISRTPFFLTRNEKAFADERPDAFRLLRLYDFAKAPRAFELTSPLEDAVRLDTETWKASFAA